MTTSVGRNSGSTATPTKATFSYWLKGQHDGTQQGIWGWHRGNDASNFWMGVYYSTNGSMYFNWKQTSLSVTLGTTQKFRDPTAWTHHVIAIDTTQGTAADRVKWYINGERVTSFEDGLDTISQNTTILNWSNSQDKMEIGTFYISSSASNLNNHFISHFHMTDGYVYDASAFGETDSTTGIWKINTSPSVTYGNEGVFVFKDDAAVTDRSGNGNNFTLDQGTLIPTQDNPSNNFPTLNPLQGIQAGEMGLLECNLYLSGNTSSQWRAIGATLAAISGKYYWEGKCIGNSGGTTIRTGICDAEQLPAVAGTKFSQQSRGWGINTSGNVTNNDSTVGGWTGTSWTTNDILMFAMDLTNSKFYIGKNGTWMNSGDPTSGSTGTGALSITSGYYYTPAHENYDAAANFAYNFGNGYFRTTAISSEGTNASNLGKFEYDVPTGYSALCTKGLNE